MIFSSSQLSDPKANEMMFNIPHSTDPWTSMIAGRHCTFCWNVDVVVVGEDHNYRRSIIIIESAKSPSEPHPDHVRDRQHQQQGGRMDSLPNFWMIDQKSLLTCTCKIIEWQLIQCRTRVQFFSVIVKLLGPEKIITISDCHNKWWFYHIKLPFWTSIDYSCQKMSTKNSFS